MCGGSRRPSIVPAVIDEFELRRPSLDSKRKRRCVMGKLVVSKLVVTEFVSIDGVFEDPGGAEGYEHGGWTFEYDRGEDGTQFKIDELMAAEAQLLGRVTYEGFAEAWPSREGEFADKLNSDPKYVVSTTLKDPAWRNTTVISDNVTEEIAKLKEQTNGSILVAGSGTLVGTLLGADLVDELRLMVFPTVLGRGKRLFPDGIDRLKLKLAESKAVGTDGVQVQVYQRAST
jgi:dihydrofolate reductase